MKHKHFIMHYSLFAALVGALGIGVADAAIRVGNKSRSNAEAYANLNAMIANSNQQQAAAAATAAAIENGDVDLPVRVANTNVAKMVARGDANAPISMAQLESCSKIYPDGEFAWDTPTAGRGAGGASTCVAVVEMRGYQMGPNGSDAVVARVNVAAGDTIRCNISDWPELSYLPDAENITFPADNEPTTDDVIQVMNQEQKKGAAIKIAATTIAGALGGNIGGKNEVGNDSLFGTGKGKMTGTAIGALGGAAIGVGSVYGGKVGGDMILSAGVNAAAGGLMGNMAASGDSVLRVEDCGTGKCVWGVVDSGTAIDGDVEMYLDISNNGSAMVCTTEKVGTNNCQKCVPESLVQIKLEGTTKSVEELQIDYFKDLSSQGKLHYHLVEQTGCYTQKMEQGVPSGDEATYVKIESAKRRGKQIPAMVEINKDKVFGMKRSDWVNWKKGNTTAPVYGRNARGEKIDLAEGEDAYMTLENFSPMYVDAEDGGIVDLSNKARAKTTLIGAGAGASLGAFSAYQGAQSDIENRWVAAVREYKDSLQKVYCITGKRFLSYYNDTVVVPDMSE